MSVKWSAYALKLLSFPNPDIEFDIPDLSELLDCDTVGLPLDALTAGRRNHKYFGIWMNLNRLAENALRNYQAAATQCDQIQHSDERFAEHRVTAGDLDRATTD
jgi:hypothetical protein